ncbi:MAG: MFS transporter [Rickettsiaceae bacterium]|nr:MFS transporter [Rickettsiaceae bacterium]
MAQINLRSFLIVLAVALVQYYDYHLFGFMAPKISKILFPLDTEEQGLNKAYFIILISYFAKPLGALILGHIGDKMGRSITLDISLMVGSLCALVIAVLPSYNDVGILSIVVLLFARMLITGVVGPGSDGVRLYIFEHINTNFRCFGEGAAIAACLLGSFCASLSVIFFTNEYFGVDGWRFAFATGAIIGSMVFCIKYFFPIKEYKVEKKEEMLVEKTDTVIKTLTKNWLLILMMSLVAGGVGSSYQFLTVFFLQYNINILKINAVFHSYLLPAAIGLFLIGSLIAGIVADYIGKIRTIHFAFSSIMLTSFYMIDLISRSEFSMLIFLVLAFILPFLIVPSHVILKTAISKSVRFRIYSFSHALGSIAISGSTSYVAIQIYNLQKISWWPICYFILIIYIMFLVTIFLSKRAKTQD